MKDAGYDVSDFRAIEPLFGTLDDARAMIAEAHELGLRVLLDIVPNHLSDQHVVVPGGARRPTRARASVPGSSSAMAAGPHGAQPPNDWRQQFRRPCLDARAPRTTAVPGQWYLHLFAPEQPDVDWTNPEVREEFDQTMRFWFDMGVDGFRIDVAHGLAKAEGLPDIGSTAWPPVSPDRPNIRTGIATRFTRSTGRGVLWPMPTTIRACSSPKPGCTTRSGWRCTSATTSCTRRSTSTSCCRHGSPSRCATRSWPRWTPTKASARRPPGCSQITTPSGRYRAMRGRRASASCAISTTCWTCPPISSSGAKRARAAALLMLALPGGAYVYQGEELGLAEVEDLPEEMLQDPGWKQSGYTLRGRDGCRVPIPWSGEEPPFGFTPNGASAPPWLPQPRSWRTLTVQAQTGDERSMLELYRRALRSAVEQPGARRRDAAVAGRARGCAGFRPRPAVRVRRQPGGRPRAGAARAPSCC